MIEMRYFTHYAPPGESGVRKLQYRVRRFRAALPFNAGFEGWGAWQDVPEFQEQPPAAHDESKEGK